MKKLITFLSLAVVGFTFAQEQEPTFTESGSVDAYFRANLTSSNDGDAYQTIPLDFDGDTNVDAFLHEGFTSISAYPQYKTSDNLSWGMRLEYMMFDMGAFYVEDGLNVFSPTLTANYTVGALTIKPELRLDAASEDVFFDNDGAAAGGLTAFNLAAVYSF